MTHSTNGGPGFSAHIDFSERQKMTDQEKTTSGRFYVEDRGDHCILWFWLKQKKIHIGMKISRGDLQQLAKGILKNEIEQYKKDLDFWKKRYFNYNADHACYVDDSSD